MYAECNQQRPLPWEQCIVPERMKRCVKIGEGTFGEVFSTVNASGETVALKVCGLGVCMLLAGSFNSFHSARGECCCVRNVKLCKLAYD